MTVYLLDTNVVSESFKRRPDDNVMRWMAQGFDCRLSVLTIGELRRGAARLRAREPARAAEIETWIDGVEERFAHDLLPIDRTVVHAWATLPATRTLPPIDSLIAATAAAHGLTVVTRNVRDFSDSDVDVVDPFEFTG
ncbi:type II toxin-antitoxin system VapC family toxin [Microbacterium sp.]|uniref:type II toxin-antitoxin system VapC family toxin n=1 Tax=Microbacterium sp. TaxID=51671 RepID=UPI0039E65CF7